MSDIDPILSELTLDSDLTLDKSWRQGRTLFGGLSGAILLQGAIQALAKPAPLRVMNVNFIAPLFTDQPAKLTVEHLRDGKNVTQIQTRLEQDGHVCVQAQTCFGATRESKIHIPATTPFPLSPPGKADFLPPIPGVTPKFLKHLQLNTQRGQLPFTGSKESLIQGWMKFKKTPKSITLPHLVALMDAWPPTVLQMLRWPKPASTLSWQLEILETNIDLAPSDWVGYDAITRQAHHGYSHTEANIWSPQGQLLAISRQTDTVFDG